MPGGNKNIKPSDNPKPFKKGQKEGIGYPKGVPNTSTRLKRILSIIQEKKNPFTGEQEGFSVAEQMDVALIAKALKGDVRAYQEIMDRFEGKITNTHEVKTDAPVQPVINVYNSKIPLASREDEVKE